MDDYRELAAEALQTQGVPARYYTLAGNVRLMWHDVRRDGIRPVGHYATLTARTCMDKRMAHAVATAIGKLLRANRLKAPNRILVAGLGNRRVLCDSLGCATIDKLTPSDGVKLVCVGVQTQTGIAGCDYLAALCRYLHPTVAIAIDALVCRDPSLLCASIQLSDASMRPGAGVGVPRGAVDKAALGVPVLHIGIPLISFTSACGCTSNCVTPQNIELMLDKCAQTLADGLRRAFKDIQ